MNMRELSHVRPTTDYAFSISLVVNGQSVVRSTSRAPAEHCRDNSYDGKFSMGVLDCTSVVRLIIMSDQWNSRRSVMISVAVGFIGQLLTNGDSI